MAIVEVVTAEQSQQELIDRARGALSGSAWVVGECASRFCEQGGTIEQFAEKLESSTTVVGFQKQVWERFAISPRGENDVRSVADLHIRNEFPDLSWSHYREAVGWDDAGKWLRKSAKSGWSKARMVEARTSGTRDDHPGSSSTKPAEKPAAPAAMPRDPRDDHGHIESPVPEPGKRVAQRQAHLEPSTAANDHPQPLRDPEAPIWTLEHAIQMVKALADDVRTLSAGEFTRVKEAVRRLIPGLFEETHGRFSPPTAAEVDEYCKSKNINLFDSSKFINFYGAKGWKLGSAPMKDWRKAVLNAVEWCSTSKPKQPGAIATPPGKYDHIDKAV